MAKFKGLVFSILMVLIAACSQKLVSTQTKGDNFQQKEQQLLLVHQKVESYFRGNFDSLTYYSNIFADNLKQLVTKNPQTLGYTFDSLQAKGACQIVTSQDGKFRIYSWDTWLGGTMHFYDNIFQYQTDSGVVTFVNAKEEGEPSGYYSDIYDRKRGDEMFYLAISNGILSTSDRSQTIKNYCVLNDQLIDSTKLFNTSILDYKSIGFGYNFFSVADREERPIKLIDVDEDNSRVLIPIVLGEGEVSNRFIVYKWDGKQFVHRFTEKEER